LCESIERFVPHKVLRKIRTLNITTRKSNDWNQRLEKLTIKEN
jgi:hypothetical protein